MHVYVYLYIVSSIVNDSPGSSSGETLEKDPDVKERGVLFAPLLSFVGFSALLG